MKRFQPHLMGIQSGQKMLFSDFSDSGPMWTGDGPRDVSHEITFPEPFTDTPHVMVAISLWDIDSGTNIRADISARDVTAQGFTLVFKTWGDSRLARIRADWTAFGAARDLDTWDVD